MSDLSRLLGSLNQLPPTAAMIVLIVGALACVLWLVVYCIAIWQNWKQKTNCIPAGAVGLNVTWELLASTVFADQTTIPAWLILERAWLVLDLVLLVQLFMYGKGMQHIPTIKKYFYPIMVAWLGFCLVGHYTFKVFCGEEPILLPDALVINTVMSILFIMMVLTRPMQKGISLPIAWCKMLGTQCNTVCMIWFVPTFYPAATTPPYYDPGPFLWFLAISIGIIDCTYIYIVSHRTKTGKAATFSLRHESI